MEFFRFKNDIPFMRHAKVFNIISLTTFSLALFFLVTKGLNFSIEFTGGTLVEVSYQQTADLDRIRAKLEADGFTDTQVINFGSSRDVLIRVPLKAGDTDRVSQRVAQSLAGLGDNPEIRRVEFVGPQVGRELAEDGALALLLVFVGIGIYLAFRFEWRFSVAAIAANLHDVVIILGFFAFFQWEFSLPVLAAVLAVLGYSVNESVVIFDRVRETFKKVRGMATPEVLNLAITRTISRTIITGGTTQIMVLSMLIFGGPALHYFALALTIGFVFGAYSSMLVATPIVMWMGVSREQFVKPKKEKAEGVTDDGACV